jgi:hypothetical protein
MDDHPHSRLVAQLGGLSYHLTASNQFSGKQLNEICAIGAAKVVIVAASPKEATPW